MAKRVRRRYGFPFTGYRSDISRDVAPLGAMTAESRDFQVSPTEGQLQLRQGYNALLASTDTSIVTRTGLLGKSWKGTAVYGYNDVAMCRQIFNVKYPYSDGVLAQYSTSKPTANAAGASTAATATTPPATVSH